MRSSNGPLWSRLWQRRDGAAMIVGSLVIAGLIFGLLYDLFDGALRRWTDRDLHRRAELIESAVAAQGRDAAPAQLQRALSSLATGNDVIGILACSSKGLLIGTAGPVGQLGCRSELARQALTANGRGKRGTVEGRDVLVTAHPLLDGQSLVVVQDRTFLDARRKHVLRLLFLFAELALLAFLLLARAAQRIGSRRTQEAARSFVRQMEENDGDATVPAELALFAHDVRATVERLRIRKPAPAAGDGSTRLRELVSAEIPNGGLVVIANREPYVHEWDADGKVVVRQPASGLVTGIEPMLRSCGGTWIAHGSGSADRAHSDRAGRLAVPPSAPEYLLRRLWIEEEEYERYYSGLANEGLWPLCHLAHTRPSFRLPDWMSYQSVNESFARAALEETPADGLLLIQDYHFALVPRMVREQAPHVVTSLFWHIPWPSAETIGICPWKESLLEGMIGADIVGFHTRQHCLNFLDSVNSYLECRVNMEEMSITADGHRTLVRPYPISVQWPYPAASRAAGAALRRSLGIGADVHVSIGVDRADYTKGLVERVEAVEALLEENPSLAGRYVLVQLASPTRTKIRKYQQLAHDLEEAVSRVNSRFGTASWKPIILEMRTFSPDEVRVHYAMADSALVTPLHDGMNLVAKEYAAACNDGEGVLVLSTFAGAARELDGALIVNPYDAHETAQAILRAIRMPAAERRARMTSMRRRIEASSIYDWSAKLLTDMAEVRREGTRFWPQRLPVADRRPSEVAG